ncbi:MAG: hypothetical protein U0L09_06210 [Christensenellales bacterium]|nr:hypothetical protein [Christensenellales bacterium]
MEQKVCVLDDAKICNNCGQCNMCDLDPTKICDNCMSCIRTGAEYNAIEIDEIIDDGTGLEEFGSGTYFPKNGKDVWRNGRDS